MGVDIFLFCARSLYSTLWAVAHQIFLYCSVVLRMGGGQGALGASIFDMAIDVIVLNTHSIQQHLFLKTVSQVTKSTS